MMTVEEARAEALRCFGPTGYAEIMPNWLVYGLGCAVGVIEEDRFRIRGTGATFEEAFHWAGKLEDIIAQREEQSHDGGRAYRH